MSTLRNPVGPQPAAVYWRRRALVGAGLLAIVLIVVLIIVRPGAEALPSPTDTPTSPTTDAAVTEPAACDPANIEVVAVTDAARYEAGVQPLLSLTVTNTGAEACTMPVGSDVQEYRITSGSDLIWSSTDCQRDPVTLEWVLEPDKSVSSTAFAWDRTRSSASTCDANRAEVGAAGASYHLTVTVDGIQSKETKQFLLF